MATRITCDRLHRRSHVVGYRLGDALIAGVVRGAGVEEDLAVGTDHLLYEMRRVVDTGRGQRGIRRCHVDHPGLVLAQHDPVVGRSTLAIFGQRVRNAREAGGNAGLVRGIGHSLWAAVELEHQPVVGGVQRHFERLGDVARPATLALDVGDLDAVDRQRRAVYLVAQADPLLKGGHQSKHLKRRSSLQSRLSEVKAIGIVATVVRTHRPVVRVDGNHGGTHVGVLPVQVFRNRLLRRPLGLRINRGGDHQPLGVEGLLIDVEQLEQLPCHLPLDQPVGSFGLILRPGQIGRHCLGKHLRRTVIRRESLGFHHAVEYPIPAGMGPFGVDRRVQRRRPPNQRCQQRPFGNGQLLDGLVEISLGRRRNAVGAPAEVDDVQIRLQHIVFRPLPRHLRRDDQFFRLAHQTAPPVLCGTDQRVLDVLLGNRRSALQIAAEQVVLDCPREAGERESRIRIEIAVFGRNHRLAHMHRHLAEVDVDPITFGRNNFGDFRAVAGKDRGDLVGTDVTWLGNVDDQVGHREGDHRQQDHHRRGEVQRTPYPFPVDLADPGQVHPRLGQPAGRLSGRTGGPGRPRWATSATKLIPPRRFTGRGGQRGRDLLERVARRGHRRCAVERGLDRLDGVRVRSRSVIGHRREDRGQSVVGWNLTTLAGIRRPARGAAGRLMVTPVAIHWPCGPRCAPSASRQTP
ncbi:Uncharacterised protein [Mycobacterium tuberculosis]|nr:Uncharacterised protein [Mycobacterium tuberculosis]